MDTVHTTRLRIPFRPGLRFTNLHGQSVSPNDPARLVFMAVRCGYWTDDLWQVPGYMENRTHTINIRCPICGDSIITIEAKDFFAGVHVGRNADPDYLKYIRTRKARCFAPVGGMFNAWQLRVRMRQEEEQSTLDRDAQPAAQADQGENLFKQYAAAGTENSNFQGPAEGPVNASPAQDAAARGKQPAFQIALTKVDLACLFQGGSVVHSTYFESHPIEIILDLK